MFIFNVLLTHEFCSPKSQFMKYQCLFSMYYHYANSAVLSRNSQNVNVCVLSMYYHVLLMYFLQESEGSLTAKSPNLSAKIWYGLTVHICFFIFKFTSKIFQIYILSFGRISSELYKFHAICPKNPTNNAKFAPFIHPLYIILSDA